MFQSLRPGNQLFILHKDKLELEIGTVSSISAPIIRYPNNGYLGAQQETIVDLSVDISDAKRNFKQVPANLDIVDFTDVTIASNRDAMNSEIYSLKKKSSDILNKIDWHKEVVEKCDSMLKEINPEFAEKAAQKEEIIDLRNQVSEMSKMMADLMTTNKQLIAQIQVNKGE